MDTEVHALALFLFTQSVEGLLFRRLPRGRSSQDMCSVALEIANRWTKRKLSNRSTIESGIIGAAHRSLGGSADAKEWRSTPVPDGLASATVFFFFFFFFV